MRVGVDDTDSPQGGCTTHFALEVAAAFRREHGLVLRGRPRLVRLNPNVPWKTRGNAAVALDFGRPSGRPAALGGVSGDGTQLWVDPEAGAEPGGPEHAATLDALVARWCDLDAPGTDPAYVIAGAAPPSWLYDRAVKGIVEPAEAREALKGVSPAPIVKALGDGRGVVGAAAAIAYPADASTFELTVYRAGDRWGTKRAVDFGSVEAMDRAFPSTFNNLDRRNQHAAVAPATPCPVLFGVRGTDPRDLAGAASMVDAGEPWGGWILFETNQGTDDHVVHSSIARAAPLETVRVFGEVARGPRRERGGHVVFEIRDGEATLACAAYEPTKEFRDFVEGLAVGDRVRAVGAIRETPRTLNLEKLEVVALAPRAARASPPDCPKCGARMKSSGRAGPMRCPACGAKAPRPEAGAADPSIRVGWHEVPVSARRHLSKPIDPHGGAPVRAAAEGEP